MYWTNYAEALILKTFSGNSIQAPRTLYAACFLSNPGETGAGTEIAYAGYSRKVIEFSSPAIGQNGTSMSNISDVSFDQSLSAAGTITHVALMDSPTPNSGSMWAYMTLDEPIAVTSGVAPLIQASEWNYISAGNFTNSYKAKILNLLRGFDMLGFNPYIALYNEDPDNGGAELAGGGYSRFRISFNSPEVQPSGQSMIKNTTLASSGRATENWGNYLYTVIFDDVSGGEAVASMKRDVSTIMGRGKAAFIEPGELSFSMN